MARNLSINGFRPGKAPLKRVEEKIGKAKIQEEVLKSLIPAVYLEAIKEHQIRPIINPQIKILSRREKEDWQIMATTCEAPPIELNDYKQSIRQALASEKIWVPGKEEETKKKKEKRLGKIFQALLVSVKIKIPQILIEEETNRMLAKLIDQTQQLNLNIEQYLASVGKTSQQLRQEYQRQAEETLKLEFILSAIADKENVQVSKAEVEKMIKTAPDEKTRKELENPLYQAYLRQLLKKRKVIDNLMKL